MPTDLDECGGHSSDSIKYYHYHFQGQYPYSVNCLRGCVDGNMNSKLSDTCVPTDTQYDYSSLKDLVISYGGDGVNHTNWTGPGCLLAFGFVFFLPSAIFCLIICCSNCCGDKDRDDKKGGMSDLEAYDEHTGDNIL